MFLSRPSVSLSVSQSVSPVFLVSATPLKPLNRISWNFVVMKDIMCTCAYPQEILIPFVSLRFTPSLNFEIWRKWKILLKQLVSTTPLKPPTRIKWNFVVMKDMICKYAFLQEMLIWSFWGAIYIPFFVRLPVHNAWNCHSLYTAFSSNVGAWGMWACSLFLSFGYIIRSQKIAWVVIMIFYRYIFIWSKNEITRIYTPETNTVMLI